MLLFFKSNYTNAEIIMMHYLIKSAVEQLERESGCKNVECMECRNCVYCNVCADLAQLLLYLKNLAKKG